MESVADVEKQQPLLSAVAADEKTSGCDGGGGGDRKACSCSTASPTATRALALVVLASGAAFAAQLAAREEYVLLAVLASQVVSFCVFTSLLALCALPEEEGKPRRRVVAPWARARLLLLWPFAMALPVSMACWAAESAPGAAGVALLTLALAAVLACYAEAVRSLWPGQ
ncbi:hypothetical protein E2562_020217 [Oryza meyeriana var. granulata]|uniref:Uncharacterized protein n=1 Tax=Oryza meyeriana var. granulata TaxID=110450 RepID=A0A6G1DKQ1_9ORYZ|nr:hypothetical protein E2562_020217 [Oryza meyeriana var. granulata]